MHYNRCPDCNRRFAEWNLRAGETCVGCQAREAVQSLRLDGWIRARVNGEDAGPEPEAPQWFTRITPGQRQSWIADRVREYDRLRREREAEQQRRAWELAELAVRPAFRERVQRRLWGA